MNEEISRIDINNVNYKLKDEDTRALGEMGKQALIKVGYYVCSTPGSTAAKTINATDYTLSTGGCIKVKMDNANTVNDATLNINSTGTKPLYYAGERASANNSWDAGETVEVYYDGTNFYANNVAGGSGSGDGAFDVSAKYPTSGVEGGNTYTLAGALAVLNANLSASKKKGGMSIKFVRTSDNKYVQYRYMGTATTGSPNPFTNPANWQGVDDEPTAGSDNLVKSGGAAGQINQLSQEVNNLKGFKAVVESNLQTLLNSMANMAFTGDRPTFDWDSIRVNVITNFVNPSGVSLSDNSTAGNVPLGGNYSGVIAANYGYILSNVSVAMAGGGTITYNQTTGSIVSSNVTGDITINATADIDADERLGYVTNGLVFMLDGIFKGSNENAWTDLVGGEVFANHGATAEEDHWLFDGIDDYLGGWDEKELDFDPAACTIEVAYISTNSSNQGRNICLLARQRTSTINCIHVTQHPGNYVNGCYVAGTDHVWNSPQTASNTLLALSPGLAISNGSVMSSAKVNHWSGNYQGRYIGTATDYTQSTPTFNKGFFKGKIFAIRIYNRQLTQAEILSNQAVDNTRFNLGISL